MSAHGNTMANSQIVLVIEAVTSTASTGISTTNDAKATRTTRDEINPVTSKKCSTPRARR